MKAGSVRFRIFIGECIDWFASGIAGNERPDAARYCRSQRVFEKFYLAASRLSMRRMAARSMKASEVWTFNS